MDEKALNELLECSVCLDRLDHTSKVLPCQHTFCRRCLEEIVSTKRELRCPECRTLVEIRVEDLPTNILLIRLLEGLKNANNPVLAAQSAGVTNLHLQSRRQDSAVSVLQGGSTSGSSGSHERQGSSSCNQVSQPSAKALYNYDAKEQGDLAFKKGDIIVLRKQIDMNWYQGELNGQTGYFPASYVQVITALPSVIPQCKALYDFDMKDENEKDCLTFHKDEIVTIIRRVDDNWIEGRKGDRIGIFPISFVELNDAAKCLINTKSSAKPSVIVTTANAAAPSRPVEIAPPTVSNPALLSVETGASKRHSLTSIATQNPPVPAHNQRRSMELVTPILVPCSISPLSSRPVRITSPSSHMPPPNPGCVVSASTTGQLSVTKHVSQLTQTAASVSSSSSASCNGSSGGRSTTDNVSVISQNMFAAAPGTLIYVAMYNYKPQKEDEVELKKGEYYTVHEKCQDGWFKGTSLKTGHSGVFPGNYVQLVRSSIPMKPVSSNVLNIRAKAPPTTTASVVIPSATVTSEPTPIHPTAVTQKDGAVSKPTAAKPNSSTSSSSESTHQRTGSNPHVPVRQSGPPLMPRMGKAAVVAASQAASASPNKSSHVTNLSSVGVVKHPHALPLTSHSNSTTSSSKGSNCKGVLHHLDQAVSGSGQSSKKTSSSGHSGGHSSGHSSSHSSGHSGQPVLTQSNPGYSNSALIVKPHAAPPAGSNIVISAPPNVVVAGATGGSVSSSSSSPSRDKDREKKDKEKKEKLSLVKRLAPGKSKRAKSHDNETVAAATGVTSVHVADVGISHVRSGSYPTEGNAGIHVAEAGQHKKTGSFDSTTTSVHSASAKSSKPKSVLREKFRCIVPYPPQSEVELELKLGDVVFVHKKREDGWYKGTLQRTGKTGLFPGSFVEKYD